VALLISKRIFGLLHIIFDCCDEFCVDLVGAILIAIRPRTVHCHVDIKSVDVSIVSYRGNSANIYRQYLLLKASKVIGLSWWFGSQSCLFQL